MSNNKKSSIEWLNDELASLNFDYLTGQIGNKEYNERHKQILEQAKAMHEEEVMQAHYAPKYGCFSEDYYSETFGE